MSFRDALGGIDHDGFRFRVLRINGIHLILLERDQGRHYQHRAFHHEAGDLINGRFARAGGHDHQRVVFGQKRANGLFLAGTQLVEPEVFPGNIENLAFSFAMRFFAVEGLFVAVIAADVIVDAESLFQVSSKNSLQSRARMEDLSRLPHRLNKAKRECDAIIETPKGRRNKFKYKPESGLFSLSNLLPQGFSFPFDFGFIPSTAADDGDPLDIIVLMDEPAHVGCLLEVRLIGVVKVEQTENGKKSRNDRLVAVAVRSFDFKDVKSISDLNDSLVEQVTEFLGLYNKNSGKQDEVQGVEGPVRAMKLLEEAIRAFDRNEKSRV